MRRHNFNHSETSLQKCYCCGFLVGGEFLFSLCRHCDLRNVDINKSNCHMNPEQFSALVTADRNFVNYINSKLDCCLLRVHGLRVSLSLSLLPSTRMCICIQYVILKIIVLSESKGGINAAHPTPPPSHTELLPEQFTQQV